MGHPEVAQRSLDIAHKRVPLPLQDNHCDCGLFLLTYAEYFTHSLPFALRTKCRQKLDPPELEGGRPTSMRVMSLGSSSCSRNPSC